MSPVSTSAQPATLYGVPMSLYTGRARSYLIKNGIPYVEEPCVSPHYYDVVLPKAGGRRSMPTLELADGTVIRDGVAIVDHFERQNGHAHMPTAPRQAIVSLLLDVVGAEGMLRPAMYYRWHHDVQREFVESNFLTIFEDQQMARERMQSLQAETNPAFGILSHTIPVIESVYADLLDALQAHFACYPYLLGYRPSIGDFGMIAPLYGHLGRDPVPLALMQARAPMAFRWVERMNRPEPDIGEYAVRGVDYLPDDEIPDTLIEVLSRLAEDFVPETRAHRDTINAWLQTQTELSPGTPMERGVGLGDWQLRSTAFSTLAQPFRFYLLARVQAAYAALDAGAQASVRAMLGECGMADVLEMSISRSIGREKNLEVWL